MEEFKTGDPVKVRFGQSTPPKYKRGVFVAYDRWNRRGIFFHTKSRKYLKRDRKEFERDDRQP